MESMDRFKDLLAGVLFSLVFIYNGKVSIFDVFCYKTGKQSPAACLSGLVRYMGIISEDRIMKSIKKTIAFLLSLIMVFSLLPAQAIAGEETGGGSRGTCKLTLYPNYDDMPASSFDYSSGSSTTPTAFKRTNYLQKKWCTMPDENAEGAECYEIGKSITLNGNL